MKAFKLALALIAIVSLAVKAAAELPPVAYFLEQTPGATDVPANLPDNAKEVVVAKVHFKMRPVWMGGRHCEGCTNDIFFTRVEVVAVTRGSAEIGQTFDVRMGLRNDNRKFAFPRTPDQLGREYTVVIYSSDDGLLRLASFPISAEQYAQWDDDNRSFERERMKELYRDNRDKSR